MNLLAIPNSQVRIGGPKPPTKEVVTCYCGHCGTMYNHKVIERTTVKPAP